MNNKIDQINSELASYVDITRQKVALQIKATFNDDLQPFISDDEAILATDRAYENLGKFQNTLTNWCIAFAVGFGLLFVKATDSVSIIVCPIIAVVAYFIVWGVKKDGVVSAIQTAQYSVIQGNQAKSPQQQPPHQSEVREPDSGFDVPPQD